MWPAIQTETKSQPLNNGKQKYYSREPEEIYKNLRDILSGSARSDSQPLLAEIEQAEKLGGCTIDFQI